MKLLERRAAVGAMALLSSAASVGQTADLPTRDDFRVGDRWEFRHSNEPARAGPAIYPRTVTNIGSTVTFNENKSYTLESIFLHGEAGQAVAPWRTWPLRVGSTWMYEGRTVLPNFGIYTETQNAEVVAYEKVEVPAGSFWAFRIEHRGSFSTSAGKSGAKLDTYWYSPEARADIKRVTVKADTKYLFELVRVQWAKR